MKSRIGKYILGGLLALGMALSAIAVPAMPALAAETGGNQVAFDSGNYTSIATPTVTLVRPKMGFRGVPWIDVLIVGKNFTGATEVSFGEGITVKSFTVLSSTQIRARISISPFTKPGFRDVSVGVPVQGGMTVQSLIGTLIRGFIVL
jgi:hypothetical protein